MGGYTHTLQLGQRHHLLRFINRPSWGSVIAVRLERYSSQLISEFVLVSFVKASSKPDSLPPCNVGQSTKSYLSVLSSSFELSLFICRAADELVAMFGRRNSAPLAEVLLGRKFAREMKLICGGDIRFEGDQLAGGIEMTKLCSET